MQRQGFGDLAADRHHRVEGGERILQDQADAAAADAAQRALIGRQQILAEEVGAAGDDARRRYAQQTQHGEHRDGFPRAAFADDCENLALVDVEGDIVHHAQRAMTALEGDGQVFDGEECHVSRGDRAGRGGRRLRGRGARRQNSGGVAAQSMP